MDISSRIERVLAEAIGRAQVPGCPPRLGAAMHYAVFPKGARIRVTDPTTGRSVTCRVKWVGPQYHEKDPHKLERVVNLPEGLFAQLAPTMDGLRTVVVTLT